MVNPVYDGWVSVGSVSEHQVSLDDRQIPIQVIFYSKYLSNANHLVISCEKGPNIVG